MGATARPDAHMAQKPLVTIVTVTLNASNMITRCIESVAHQSYDNIEYIIIDGVSTDGTLEIIKSYGHVISRWISERDEGIFHAMNKGIDLAKGEIISFLNADDYYEPDAVEKLVDMIITNKLGYSYAAMRLHKRNLPNVTLYSKCKNLADALTLQEMPFPHPTLFVRKSVFKRVGRFDTQYRYSADYEFALRLLKANVRGEGVSAVLANYQVGGASSCQKALSECLSIAIRHGKNPIAAANVFLGRTIRRQLSIIIPENIKSYLLQIKNGF